MGEIELKLVFAAVLVLDRLVTLRIVENRQFSIHTAQLMGLFEFEINVLDRNFLIVGEMSGLIFKRLQVDYIWFEVSFGHEQALPCVGWSQNKRIIGQNSPLRSEIRQSSANQGEVIEITDRSGRQRRISGNGSAIQATSRTIVIVNRIVQRRAIIPQHNTALGPFEATAELGSSVVLV